MFSGVGPTACTTFCEGYRPGSYVLIHRYTWRRLASYAFITIKLASCHLLLYVVYMYIKNYKILQMHSIVISKNESWPRLIWPTLNIKLRTL